MSDTGAGERGGVGFVGGGSFTGEKVVEFAIGVAVGLGASAWLSWMVQYREWEDKRKIDNRLKYLESNLCCGKGFFGCTGGPNCKWDHK